MLLELRNEGNFRKKYFEMLKYRLAYGSLELEGINGDLASAKQAMKILNQLNAINYIFEMPEKKLSHIEFTNLLCNLVEKVTGEEVTNFRTTKAIVNGSKVKRTDPQMIRNDLWYLIDDYNYQIDNLKDVQSIYEIEANFHIRLLHIHPFEDGNGRTARILLAYNLCKNNVAPCVITKETKEKYCEFIENGDVKGLAGFLEELSKKELSIMVSLYKELDSQGLIEENIMSPTQETMYEEQKKKL